MVVALITSEVRLGLLAFIDQNVVADSFVVELSVGTTNVSRFVVGLHIAFLANNDMLS